MTSDDQRPRRAERDARRRRRRSSWSLVVDGAGDACGVDRASRSSTTCSSSSASTAASTSRSRREGDLEVDLHHTVEDVGIAARRVPQGGARRQGRACGASRPRSCRSTRRSCRSRSTCRAGRSSSTRSIRSSSGSARSTRSSARSSGARSRSRPAITLHMKSLSGANGHHVIEASFKGVARVAARRGAGRGRRRPEHEGHAVRPTGT